MQYPGLSDKVDYQYDDLRRLEKVILDRGMLDKQELITYKYTTDKYERLDKMTYKNGVETTYGYDDHDRGNKISTVQGSNTIFTHEYNYDELGNRKDFTWSIDKSGKNNVSYTYDTQYQLTGVKYDDGRSFIYKYDDNGNRTYFAHDFGYETLSYGQFDRLQSRDMRDYKIEYQYDGRGNLIEKKGLKTNSYTFDLNDRLIATYEDGAKTAEYAYDYRGMRVMSEFRPISPAGSFPADAMKPNTSYYWYGNGSEVLADTNASGNVTALYIMAGKQKVAVIKPKAAATATAPEQPERMSYFHCDVLGSVVAITDEVGLIKEANIYGPFGESEFSYKGKFYKDYGFDNRYGYTGQEQDTPGGLMYYGARWYDSEIGRFISEDPARQYLNTFIYCANNPLIMTDPTGRWAIGFKIFGFGISIGDKGFSASIPFLTIGVNFADGSVYARVGLDISSKLEIGVASIGYDLYVGVTADSRGKQYVSASAGVFATCLGAVAHFGASYTSIDGKINVGGGLDYNLDLGDLTPKEKPKEMPKVEPKAPVQGKDVSSNKNTSSQYSRKEKLNEALLGYNQGRSGSNNPEDIEMASLGMSMISAGSTIFFTPIGFASVIAGAGFTAYAYRHELQLAWNVGAIARKKEINDWSL